MKIRTVSALVFIGGIAATSAWADHNSLFGDNTGRTIGGVHDDRIESNLEGMGNRSAMGQGQFQVQSQGALGGYHQGGAPATVVPGAGAGVAGHGGGRR
jgi:hypothetical protein